MRLRDLAGLIVIDFIDMESRRNNAAVEKRMKDALKDDRARIQLGPISHFGLMEMSRQRLRPSLTETSFTPCPHCGGTGYVRSTETSALAVLRAIEEEGAKRRAAEIIVHVAGAIALYVLNHKRARIAEIEARYGMTVAFAADETLLAPQTRIERCGPRCRAARRCPWRCRSRSAPCRPMPRTTWLRRKTRRRPRRRRGRPLPKPRPARPPRSRSSGAASVAAAAAAAAARRPAPTRPHNSRRRTRRSPSSLRSPPSRAAR